MMNNESKQAPGQDGPEHQLTSHSETRQRSGKNRIWVWLIVLLAFGLTLFLILRLQRQSQQAATGRRGFAGPVTVRTAKAKAGDIGIYLEAIGTVTPVYTASITSQVNGQVVAVRYREGQLVRKGDPLVEIDPRPYEAQLAAAQGTLEHDTNLLAQAKMDLERYRTAWAANAIPKQTLDDQEKLVLQDEGTVKTDEGNVRYDQVQVGFCHIASPITGKVGLRFVDPGNVVQTGSSTVLAVITQVQPITVIFTIPEDSLGQVQQQLKKGARLAVEAYDRTSQTKLGTGVLLTTDNQIDTTTGTLKLRAQFENKDQGLFPNAFVNTKLLVNTLHNVTLIPTSAIQHNGEAAFVYVLQKPSPGGHTPGGQTSGAGAPSGAPEQGTHGPGASPQGAPSMANGGGNGSVQPHSGPTLAAQMRPVKVGATTGLVSAVEGLKDGEIVANSSFDKLQNGSMVIVSDKPLPGDTSESTAP